ncbi:hypothetical protein, partial [Escherichia coli]|uniref:hypothetical protein n=1 Tax=Escherichia coli TaxID=562 RepID=UPI0032E3D8AD
DRLELLQKLFGTQRFEALEQELGRQAQEAQSGVAALNGELGHLAARAESEAAALELDETGAPPQDDVAARLEWLQAAVAERQRELAGLAKAAEAESTKHARAVEEESARIGRRRKLEAAAARRAAVEDAAPHLETLTGRLARHRQAEVLAGHLNGVDTAAAKVRSAASAAESAATLLGLAAGENGELAQLDLGPADVPGTDVAGAAVDELARLRSLLAVVEARMPDEERLHALRTRHSGLDRKQQELGTHMAGLGSRLVSL